MCQQYILLINKLLALAIFSSTRTVSNRRVREPHTHYVSQQTLVVECYSPSSRFDPACHFVEHCNALDPVNSVFPSS